MPLPKELVAGTKELTAENTAERLSTKSVETVAVVVRALKANAATLYVGPESVNTEAFELEKGESIEFELIDISQVWVYGKKGDKVKYLGLKP